MQDDDFVIADRWPPCEDVSTFPEERRPNKVTHFFFSKLGLLTDVGTDGKPWPSISNPVSLDEQERLKLRTCRHMYKLTSAVNAERCCTWHT